MKLPIDPILPQAIASLERVPCLVLQASPGSGKTTRLPPALLESSLVPKDREILVLEPRRLAAKYAALRVSQELGEPLGQSVGYHFRFENVGGPKTRLRFLTEGMLMRRLISDPQLSRVSAVVLDEFHERHLHGDIALSYLRKLQLGPRQDLRLVVMSATLDTAAVSSFLGGCPVLNVDAPVHPVEVVHLPAPPARGLEHAVKAAVRQALSRSERYPGDILVFLPGMSDIRRCEQALAELAGDELLVLPLHGDLTREEQDRAVTRQRQRKVILSTNVAETSLTIEGLTAVIDSGLHRQASFSHWSGVPALKTRPTSRASAIQRAGRAGRTAPGLCLRLFTQGDLDSRPPFETPEIKRADLCQTVLELKALGVEDTARFPWFDAPGEQALRGAERLLYKLGAIDRESGASSITALGREISRIPAHPRLGRVLLEARARGLLEPAATLCALIGEGELDRLDAMEQALQSGNNPFLRRARTQLLSSVPKATEARVSSRHGKSDHDELAFCALTGFPDRVALKRKLTASSSRARAGEVELVFSSGGSALLEETSAISGAESFVVLDIQEQQQLGQARAQPRVRSLATIELEWLFDLEPSALRDEMKVEWDRERGRAFQVSRLAYDELVLSEDRKPLVLNEENAALAGPLLLREALGVNPDDATALGLPQWAAALGKVMDPETAEALIARLALAVRHSPGSLDPARLGPLIGDSIARLLAGRASLAEIGSIDWETELPALLFEGDARKLETLTPTHAVLAKGRRAKIHYRLEQPPWVESRLQDFFGLKQGPSILSGRLPLTLHLLAPNQRAIQVTTDLAGFWQRAYQELRPALSRRYPRHAWPENPLELMG